MNMTEVIDNLGEVVSWHPREAPTQFVAIIGYDTDSNTVFIDSDTVSEREVSPGELSLDVPAIVLECCPGTEIPYPAPGMTTECPVCRSVFAV